MLTPFWELTLFITKKEKEITNSLLQTEISEIDILKQEIATIKALLIPTNNTNNITQN